jgi:hypothetical protein
MVTRHHLFITNKLVITIILILALFFSNIVERGRSAIFRS